MSRAHMALQGLRRSTVPASPPSSPVVLAMMDTPSYRPARQPLFFVDGSLAVSGEEPRIVCDDYRLKIRQPNGRTCWVRVSHESYLRASVGQPMPA